MTLDYTPDAAYILEDERVLLRPLVEADYEFLLPFALNEPDYVEVLSRKRQRGRRDAPIHQRCACLLKLAVQSTLLLFLINTPGSMPAAQGFTTLNLPGKRCN